MPDVRRSEEPLWVSFDQGFLKSRGRREPRGPAVIVMTVCGCDELALSDEPARFPMAQPFGRFRQRKADRAESFVGIVHAAM